MNKYRISELFLSLQGEGLYTGKNTAWVRLFNCNLSCDGFFQDDPTKPETYDLPYKDYDISKINMVEELPVFEKGCDSSYSWAKKYKHLIPEYSAEDIASQLKTLVKGNFYEVHGNHIKNTHLCFTGGEPLLRPNQKAIIDILKELEADDNLPRHVTFETNSTVELTKEFVACISYYQSKGIEFLGSCSPKLFNVSGELNKKAWKHDVSLQYHNVFDLITYKFVVNQLESTWIELDEYISKMQHVSDNIYIMPVGATIEQQSTDVIKEIVVNALERGFHISGRLHCYIFGNALAT